MAIKKKVTAAATKSAKAETAENSVAESITVQRTFTEDGELNTDDETIEVRLFPAGAPVGKVSIGVGTAAPYGEVKAYVTVTVPALLDEIEDGSAAKYASAKAEEFLDALSELTAADEQEEEKPKGKTSGKGGKAEVTSSRKAGGKAPKEPEPEEDDEAEAEGDAEDGEELTPEDIEAMDRGELESFIEEWNEDDDNEDNQIELDLADFKKNAKGLAALREAITEIVFADEAYDEETLQAMDEDELKAICKEWEIPYSKAKKEASRKAEAIEAIMEYQENAGEDGEE